LRTAVKTGGKDELESAEGELRREGGCQGKGLAVRWKPEGAIGRMREEIDRTNGEGVSKVREGNRR